MCFSNWVCFSYWMHTFQKSLPDPIQVNHSSFRDCFLVWLDAGFSKEHHLKFQAESDNVRGKKENLISHFVTWNLVFSPFPCLISAYLTLKQTEKELNPNLSEVLCCSWFCCCCIVFFILFLFCYFMAVLIILFSIAFCHHFFLVALFLCPWFMTDTCLTSLSFQKNSFILGRGSWTQGATLPFCYAGLFLGMLK